MSKLIFFGTPEFAVPILKKIFESKYLIQCVYTQPPKKSNRGQNIRKSQVQNVSEDLNINFLGEIPLIKSLREASDFGRPASLQESTEVSKIFDDISKNVVEQLLKRNKELPPTKIVEITNLVGCSAIKK